jgi:Domain of unknown function (DUF4832)/Domain of unknown function (DUF4874)
MLLFNKSISTKFLYCFLLLLFAACKKSKKTNTMPAVIAGNKLVNYTEDKSNFSNPERGFFGRTVSYSNNPSPFYQNYFDQLKAISISLVSKIYVLNNFKSGPIAASFLQHIQNDMDIARNNGFKIVLRFNYTHNEAPPLTDAPENIVLAHIDQLTPILQKNVDVIALMEAGFIGEWGEWHDSSNGLTTTASMRNILFKLLGALPKQRAVVIRYQQAKKDIFNISDAIGQADAYNGTNRSRTGHHNDCFLAAADDWGTYWPIDAVSLAAQKNYLNQENKYLPQVGETCNCNPPHSDCTSAMQELAKMRWSALNRDYIDCVLNNWISQGCYTDIAKRLGYRFRLLSADVPEAVKTNTNLIFTLSLKNDGFASPYNLRNAELILRPKNGGAVEKIKLNTDVRNWHPDIDIIKENISVLIPNTVNEGIYDMLINFYDPETALRTNPSYSIRLANQNVWEPASGYNALLTSIKISK